jgi:hypothetical protein
MTDLILELEGESLEEVRAEARARTPAGLSILNEEILADGKVYQAVGEADTAEEATALAKSKVPAAVTIVEKKLSVAPARRTVDVEAWDEDAARAKVREGIHSWERVESVVLKTPGRKGMLGMGKTPGVYSATVFLPALYEIAYKMGEARIRVVIGRRNHHPSGFCQFCGKAGAPIRIADNIVHYFCPSACEAAYTKAKLLSLRTGAGVFVMNASGREIGGMLEEARQAGKQARAHCWRCGRIIEMTFRNCPKCGKDQNTPA